MLNISINDNKIITQMYILNNTIIGIAFKQLMHIQYIYSPCPI